LFVEGPGLAKGLELGNLSALSWLGRRGFGEAKVVLFGAENAQGL
jgi:hypothetical protein